MIIRKYVYDYVGFKWIDWGIHKGLTNQFYADNDKTYIVFYYSHIVKDLILATNIDMESIAANMLIMEELRRYHIYVNKLADHQIEYHSNLVRGSHYIKLRNIIVELNKILLTC